MCQLKHRRRSRSAASPSSSPFGVAGSGTEEKGSLINVKAATDMSHACQILTFDILQARDANAARMVAAWLDEHSTHKHTHKYREGTRATTSSRNKELECKRRRVSRLFTYLKIHRIRGALIHPLECHFVCQRAQPQNAGRGRGRGRRT